MGEERNICYYTNSYNHQFGLIEHYRRYPQMMPFVGKYYKKGYVLLFGESHYLPEGSEIHHDARQWYEGYVSRLDDEERGWTNTKEIVNSHVRQKRFTFWRNLVQALCEAAGQEDCSSSIIQNFSFMNAFQRPAEEGNSLRVTALDTQESGEVIRRVIEILSPGTCIFLGKKAARPFKESIVQQDVMVGETQHPSRPWWYRQSRPEMITGRERFIRFIREANRP